MPLPFVEENRKSRARLAELARRLSDEELARSNAHGWTVAALLAHLAWWDRRVLVLLERWKQSEVDASPIDADATNGALKALCLALEPRQAIELCLAAAEAVDAELETVTPELVEQVQAIPMQFRFNRALHRNDHLNEIERVLDKG
jgi:hypothetical protein